jgi:hypothetical protein
MQKVTENRGRYVQITHEEGAGKKALILYDGFPHMLH